MKTAIDNAGEEGRLYSSLFLATTVLLLFSDVLAIFFSISFGSPANRAIAYVTTFLLLPMSFGSFLFARRDKVQLAVLLNIAVWYILALAMILIGSRLYSVMLVCSIMPVLLAMPFVASDILQKIIVVSISFILAGVIAANLPPFFIPTLSDSLMAYVDAIISSLLLVVVMISIWKAGGRLAAATNGMANANEKLKKSEQSLEVKVDELTAELNRAAQEIADLNQIASIVNATLDVDKVVYTIYNAVQKKISIDQTSVFLINAEVDRLYMTLSAGKPFVPALQNILKSEGLPLDAMDTSIASSVVNNKTIYFRTVSDGVVKAAGAGDQRIYQYHRIKSGLLCPLAVKGKAIGCIFFNSSSEQFELSESEIHSIERYVIQLGTAIHNAQLSQVNLVVNNSNNLSQQELPETTSLPEVKSSTATEAYPGLYIERGLGRLAGNGKLYLESLWNLLDEYGNTAFYLASLLEADNTDEVKAIVHKLSGIANDLGAYKIGECAEDIERLLISEEPVSANNIEALSDALTQLSDSTASYAADQDP